MQKSESWLKITDSEISSAELVAEVETRVERRRQALGEIWPKFPDFGVLSPMPELTLANAALAHHLRLANEMEPPSMSAVLAPSPATRILVLGRLWGLVRAQFHELILFYVNRAASHQAKLDNHLISTLNELTRITQEQQLEIERLQEEIRILHEDQV